MLNLAGTPPSRTSTRGGGYRLRRRLDAWRRTSGRPDRRLDEAVEQRVRSIRSRTELRVELAGHEPRVVLELDDLDQAAVGRLAGHDHAVLFKCLAVPVADLETMPVP